MTRWYPLEPADDDFLASAPHIFRYEKRFAASPDKVWESLTSDASLSTWSSTIKEVKWTSPRPFGVGATREVQPQGGPRVKERYFRWDEGRRHSFYVERANLPMFKSLAEDYLVEPAGPDACRFTWTIAADPTAAGKLGSPLNKRIVEGLFHDTRRHFS